MTSEARGFCLMEALVSVLVLSIGLLGLAQLQARLWSAASDLHARGMAYHFALSELEQSLHALSTVSGGGAAAAELTTPATVFHAVTTPVSDPGVPGISVVVSWDDRADRRSIQLQGSVIPAPGADARWLLPSRHPATAYPANATADRQPPENPR